MRFYLAPLEGITGYIFRNALRQYFGEGIDKYYTPFLTPHIKRAFSSKELNEISVENNKSLNLVPQILTGDSDDFTRLAGELRNIGYEEVNLNLGCPSKTVANKGRGAGALRDIDKLDDFLYRIYDAEVRQNGCSRISIKTRLGIENPEEFAAIFEIYKKYPIYELTIHPRVMKEVYSGIVHQDIFIDCLNNCDFNVCYNGDINSIDDYKKLMVDITDFTKSLPSNLTGVMIGRGLLKNPALVRELDGGESATNQEIYDFLLCLRSEYEKIFSGQTPLLFKLKEVWSYLQTRYPDKDKLCKKLLKSKSLQEYEVYVKQILEV